MTNPAPALVALAGYLEGARLDGDRPAVARLLATRALLLGVTDPDEGRKHLALAAHQMLQLHAEFGEAENIEARIVLLGLPDQAALLLPRIRLGVHPSAELVTTFNLAALLAGRSAALVPTPGRRTDVAAARARGDTVTLLRLARRDIARLRGLGNRFYDHPDHWYPIFAALLRLCTAHVHLTIALPEPDVVVG
jgi:hypothetical protein